jgi:hypothetical protein
MPSETTTSVRKLAMLTADAIEVAVTVVTAPAKWTVRSLRWFAAQEEDSKTAPPAGLDGEPLDAD